MGTFKAAWVIARENLAEWRKNDRILVLLVLSALLICVYIGKLPVYAVVHHQKNTLFLLPLLFADAMNANGLLKVLLFFGTIFLFCNAPFLDEHKYFLILRSHRSGWWLGEVLYVIAGSFCYMLELFVISTLIALPCASIGQGWGESIMTAFDSPPDVYLQIVTGISLPPVLLLNTTPETAIWYTFLVSWLVMVLLGLLIYCINLYSGKSWPGVAVAVFLVLLDPVLRYTQTSYNMFDLLLSPVSWSSIENVQKYSGVGMLTIPYIVAAGLGLSALLIFLIARKSRKMDILLTQL
ncbi:MAG: hypothetical protein IJV50_05405 [Lachnospiraceae bacterium]|nr:hypothetical protein [Lachnospiraceae bacterium]